MKRMINLFYLTIFIFTSIAINNKYTYADTGAVIEVSNSYELSYNGDGKYEIPIIIDKNPGIMGFKISLSYDDKKLHVEKIIRGDALDNGMIIDNSDIKTGIIDVMWSNVENIYNNGIIFYIIAERLCTQSENINISISYSQEDTFDEQYNDVILDCKDYIINGNSDDISLDNINDNNDSKVDNSEKNKEEKNAEIVLTTAVESMKNNENIKNKMGEFYNNTLKNRSIDALNEKELDVIVKELDKTGVDIALLDEIEDLETKKDIIEGIKDSIERESDISSDNNIFCSLNYIYIVIIAFTGVVVYVFYYKKIIKKNNP